MMDGDLISRSGLIKRLEMISKNCKANKAVSKYIGKQIFDISETTVDVCIREAENVPAVDAVPVVHGRWEFEVTKEFGCRYNYFAVKAKCSECGKKRPAWYGAFQNLDDEEAELAALVNAAVQKHPKFCEECGADMRERAVEGAGPYKEVEE